MGSAANGQQPASPDDILQDQVERAYAALCFANRHSIAVQKDIIDVVVLARHAMLETGGMDDVLEAKFCNAAGVLGSFPPAERARRFYLGTFYAVLVSLLSLQIYYLSGGLVRDRLADVGKQYQQAAQAAAPAAPAPAAPDGAPTPETYQRLQRFATSQAYYDLARHLLPFFQEVKASDIPGTDRASSSFAFHLIQYTKLRGELDLVLLFLSGYVLPIFYGLLGACAAVLRELSDPWSRPKFGHDARVRNALRLPIGAVGGLAVGWFVNADGSGLGALSPLALAFVAGYGTDLLFALLDRVVQAFVPARGSQVSTRVETTVDGMTLTRQMEQETHVAGPVVRRAGRADAEAPHDASARTPHGASARAA